MSKGIDVSGAASVSQREDEGQVVHIRDANGEPEMDGDKPVTVRIAGTYSRVYRRTQEAQTQRMFKRRQAALTAEQWTANRIELVAACIMEWAGFYNRGQPFPYTKENATLLLTGAPWILTQLEEAQADHAGFSTGSSAS